MAIKIQLRRGTAAQWTAQNPVLSAGEPGVEVDTSKIKIGDGSTAWNSLLYATGSVTAAATALVEATRVTGEAMNRYERRVDGSIAIGPGGNKALRNTEGIWVMDMGTVLDRDGIRIYGPQGQTGSSQILIVLDYLGAPIFAIPAAGGPSVFGDDFRIFAGGDIFNPEIALRKNGAVQVRRGDTGGGAGVLAIGAATTPPTRNPDGTQTVSGAVVVMSNVLYADANGRLWSRRGSGPTDLIGGNYQSTTAPSTGVQPGDTYYNSTSHRVHYNDGASWPRLGLQHTPPASAPVKVNEYLMPPWMFANGAAAPTASQMMLQPIDVHDWGMTFDRVGVRITGAGVGGSPMARFGVYADDGTGGAPTGAPLADWGLTGAQTTANTESTATISWVPPRLGRFWLAVAYQPTGTQTTVPTWAMFNGPSLAQTNLDLSFPIRSLLQAGVTGALPTIGTLTKSGAAYSVGLRRSA